MTQFSVLYGGSLYALAEAEGLSETILADLQLTAAAFEKHPDYVRLLDAPTMLNEDKRRLLDEAFAAHIHPYTSNFLKILAEKKQVRALAAARRTFVKQYNADRGIEEAVAVTAVPLSAALKEKLTAKLEKMTGKTVVLENKVEPGILGGITVRMANRQMDASVRTRLENLEKQLSESW